MVMKQMRKHAKKLLIIIAIFIIPAFVLWGAGSALRSRKLQQYAGEIFGKKISLEKYSQSWQACRNQALMLYGQNLDKIANFLDLEQQAWERLILSKEAKKKGITVRDKEIIDTIKNLPFFQKDKKFDKETYKTTVRYIFRTTPQEFEQQIKNSLIIQKLIAQILEDVKVTDEELKQAYLEENEKVKVSYILFKPVTFESEVKVSLEKLKNYYQNHELKFKQPPKVKVKYLPIAYENVRKQIKVTTEEIKDYFNVHKEELSPEESEENSDTEEVTLTEEIKNKIKSNLIEQKTEEKAKEKAQIISDFLIHTPNLEKAGQEFSLPIKQTDYFTIHEPIPDIGWSFTFTQKAFSLEKNEISDIIKVAQKGFYFIKVIDKKEVTIPEFEQIKQKVELSYKKYISDKLAKKSAEEKLNELTDYLNDGNNWRGSLDKANLEAEDTTLFKRSDYIKNIGYSDDFVKANFSTTPGKLHDKVISLRKGYCLVRPVERKDVDPEEFEQKKEKFRQDYLASKKQQYYINWINDLKQQADLKSNLAKLKKQAQESRKKQSEE